MFVRGYASEYIKKQCGLGRHMSYVLSIPLQPLRRYAVILYILSAENKQTHSLILWNVFFPFESPKLQFPVRGWSGARRHLLILRASRGESVWCGEERLSAPDLQYSTGEDRQRSCEADTGQRGNATTSLTEEKLVINIHLTRQFPQFPPKANTSDSTL